MPTTPATYDTGQYDDAEYDNTTPSGGVTYERTVPSTLKSTHTG